MHIELIRYHETLDETKSEMLIDGVHFGEAREVGTAAAERPRRLPRGDYRCRCAASPISPMTLRVARPQGYRLTIFAWDPLCQHRAGRILVGQADPLAPPESRTIDRQQDTFDRLTQRLYQAYAREEDITLAIRQVLLLPLAAAL